MNLFHNKRVALIGSAKYLDYFKQADYINSFDLVVRINTAIPLTDRIKLKTGERCDVLYMNVEKDRIYNSKELLNLIQLRVNPDFYIDPKYIPILEKYQGRVKNTIPINKEYAAGLVEHLDNTFPNTGLTAMLEILSEDPKELYLTGFTFWQEGGHYSGYRKKAISKRIEYLKGDHNIHRQEPQIKYFLNHIINDQRIIIDNTIKQLCQKLQFKFL